MHTHSETRHSPHTPAQLYAMVMDVEKYPEFLPWCKAARVSKQQAEHFIGELVIGYKTITESYKSKVVGNPAQQRIAVSLVSGPFKYLTNDWYFEPEPQGGTQIHFTLSFKFRSKLLDSLMGSFFSNAVEKMTQAFIDRADALYG